jgi:transcriptional regulator with XRE-family HTH domain
MPRRNFRLKQAFWEQRIIQCEFARDVNLASEARLSRIINGLVEPTQEEIQKICRALSRTPSELGFIATAPDF